VLVRETLSTLCHPFARLTSRPRRYVQQNCITHISGLENVPLLDTLNISSNRLKKLEGLTCCPLLTTLIATDNLLSDYDSVAHVAGCKALLTLDLQNNKIDDPAIVDVLTQIPDLRCLYLKGNPVVSKIKSYRKTIIAQIPTLTYLDDRPVFPVERKCAEAW
jgi:dynein assembly factor 1, axonemal